MKKEFVMRGQTVSSGEEVLNFSGHKDGYAYRLVEFQLWGTTNLGGAAAESFAAITAAKVAEDPINPDFNNDGLIGVASFTLYQNAPFNPIAHSVVNDTFLITQNLILSCRDTNNNTPLNWQCRFESVKMNDAEEAATNFKQFTISDE